MKLPARLFATLFALSSLSTFAWAEILDTPGIPNFRRVNARILRGGQPGDEGWQRLAAMGVHTVIDLRRVGEHSTEAESRAVEGAGMRYLNVPMNGFETPNAEQIAKVMSVLTGTDTVFIHCKQGKDRTGTMVALYRIGYEGWKNHQALEEAESCGIHWYEVGMKRLIMGYSSPAPALAETSLPSTPSSTPAAPEAVVQTP